MSNATTAPTITLECIDGKDDHFKVELENSEKVILGKNSDNEGKKIKELEDDGGFIILTNNNGDLHVDAAGSAIPVKINGRVITSGIVKDTDVLLIGHSIWKSFLPEGTVSNPAKNTSFTTSFSNLVGLEALKDFKLGSIFSEVFKKHTLAETEEQLFTGTTKNTPAITDIEISWAKPWLFSRIIVLAVVLTLILVLTFNQFTNTKLIPNLIVIGTFVMPIATMIFFMELNAPRNISMFLLLLLLFIGGVGSLVLTILISSPLAFIYKTFGAAGAPFIEEPAKILLVLVVIKFVRYRWTLNGLLFGAAVGAGFGAFESAGYAFDNMLAQGGVLNVQAGVDNILLRGMLAPFMHVIWTANAAAALWMVKGDKPFTMNMLVAPKFLRIFLLSVVLHFLWNSSFGIVRIPIFFDVKYLLLGVIAWTVCFMLIQTGLKELNTARHLELERLRSV